MAPDAPRVRFAPSPTGYFHVGSARTALFNWLVARQSGGTFVLRIEDTDAERNREEWVEGILTALHWLGMDADEGPYRQSARTARYHEAIDALWDAGLLYACGCTHDEVTARNKAAGILTPGYDGHCRTLGLAREAGRALRFATPAEGTVVVPDVIRGDVEFPCSAMDDFVAVKGNGAPLFVLANVVDDIDMAISHVIRGEDLLPTTPKGILLWQAMASIGWTTDGTVGPEDAPTPALPVFAHLPMLVNEARKKLSKRKDPVAVESYRDQGYLADAFVNYLGLLGWSPPNDGPEVFTRDQMVEWFALADVNHSPAFFDVAKLTHMNGEYLRAMTTDAFIEACGPWLAPGPGPVAGRPVRRRRVRSHGPGGPGTGGGTRRGAGHGRLPLPRRAGHRPRFVGEGGGRRRRRTGHPGRGHGRLRGAARRVDRRGAARRHARGGRVGRTQAGQGPGADPRRRHRAPGGPAALRGPRGARPGPHPRPPGRRGRPPGRRRSRPLMTRGATAGPGR